MTWLIKSLLLVLCIAAPCSAAETYSLSADLNAAVRQDNIDWNIAGEGGQPNVLSQLEWDDLTIYQLSMASTLVVKNNKVPFATYVRLNADYGWIVDGDVQDSDYNGNHRTLEYSRTYSDGDDGDVIDLSAGLGFQFSLLNDTLCIAPLVGYSYHEQNLTMRDGVQVIEAGHRLDGVGSTIVGLDSSYDTQWSGLWLGVDMEWQPYRCVVISGVVEYHYADYEAQADWNLRDDFEHPVSFEHKADAHGVIGELQLRYLLSDHWAIHVAGKYSRWQTKHGADELFLAAGSSVTTQLNEVNWRSMAATVGVRYTFL